MTINIGTGQSVDAGMRSESRQAGEWVCKASNDLIGHHNAGVYMQTHGIYLLSNLSTILSVPSLYLSVSI